MGNRKNGQTVNENEKKRQKQTDEEHLYIIIDELADLMLSAKKQIEPLLIKISQLGRAAGVHLVVATQDPRRATISAAIQSNMTTIVALRCRSGIESRLLLQCSGAEKLPKYGTALMLSSNYTQIHQIPIRLTPDSEFERLLKFQKDVTPRILRPPIFSKL